jgi:DNA-binding Lrp family transcriptional regulator
MSTIPNRHDDEHTPKPPPFAQLPLHVLNHPDLNAGDRELYARLDTYWRKKSDVCWVGQERLASEMGVSVDTVQRRLRKLKKAKVIEIRRRGLTHTNLYVRLQPRHLHAVHDEAPDTAEVRLPETATVRRPEAAAVRHEVDGVEVDAREEDTRLSVDGGAKNAPPSLPPSNEHPIDENTEAALVALVEVLSDSDARTLKVFRRDFGHLHADAAWFALDVLDERQRRARTSPSVYDPIHHEAGYARGILEAVANGYSPYDDWSAFFTEDR